MKHFLAVVQRPLRSNPATRPRYDAIVVLGSPVMPDGTLSPVVAERVSCAAKLWHDRVAATIVVSGGKTRHLGPTEAAAMAFGLANLGVPKSAIVIEDQARSTYENALHVAAIFKRNDWRTALIVTQPFHLRRSQYWFTKHGLLVDGYHIVGGLESQDPVRALRWTAREYLSWLNLWLRLRQ